MVDDELAETLQQGVEAAGDMANEASLVTAARFCWIAGDSDSASSYLERVRHPPLGASVETVSKRSHAHDALLLRGWLALDLAVENRLDDRFSFKPALEFFTMCERYV